MLWNQAFMVCVLKMWSSFAWWQGSPYVIFQSSPSTRIFLVRAVDRVGVISQHFNDNSSTSTQIGLIANGHNILIDAYK